MEEYLGMVKLFAGTFVPDGWIYCDGQLNLLRSILLCFLFWETFMAEMEKIPLLFQNLKE